MTQRAASSPFADLDWLLEQNDERAVQRAGYMALETISQMSSDPLISLSAVAH